MTKVMMTETMTDMTKVLVHIQAINLLMSIMPLNHTFLFLLHAQVPVFKIKYEEEELQLVQSRTNDDAKNLNYVE